MTNWILCSERLPEKGEWCLFWYPWGHEINTIKGYGISDKPIYYRSFIYDKSPPSHWMPLPKPPEEEGK